MISHLFFRKLLFFCKYLFGDGKMYCLICNNEFVEKRTLKDLFRTRKFYVCNCCLNKYPYNIERSVIPLNNHNLEIISLFEKERKINYDAFTYEFSALYKKVCELNIKELIFYCNKLYVNEEAIENYNQISMLLDKDIIILTNVLLI